MTKTEKKENLKSFIANAGRRIEKSKSLLQENFTYHFPWVGEDLWKDEWKMSHYHAILKDLLSDEDAMDIWIKRFDEFISRSYNVRENSTGTLHREVSTWKFIATMELRQEINSINQ